MNYVLVKAQDGVEHEELCKRIEQRTGRSSRPRFELLERRPLGPPALPPAS